MSWLLWALAAMFSIAISSLLMKSLAVKGDFVEVVSSPNNILPLAGVVVFSLFTAFAVFNALRDPKINPGVVGAVIGLNAVLITAAAVFLFPETVLKPTQILALVLALASVALLAL